MTETCCMIAMNTGIRALVEAIHSTPTQSVLYISGGASQAVAWLLSVPGASSTVLEAVVPYSRMLMIQLLGKIPDKFCSQHTAEDMAQLAYNRALKLSSPGSPVVGVGFTGSLATSRPKLRDHRFYLSTRTSDRLSVSTVTLSKGSRNREEEDMVASHIVLKPFYQCGYRKLQTRAKFLEHLFQVSLNLKYLRNVKSSSAKMKN